MVYDIVLGRNDSDKEKFKKEGLVLIGKHFVKMGETTSLSNKVYLDMARPHVILLSGKRGSGKCLAGDTLISLEDGSLAQIKELEHNNNKIIALNDQFRTKTSKKSDFFSREVDQLLKIRLRSGKEIKLTPEHPLLTIKGWKPIQDLNVGSRIATPRKIPSFGTNELPEHEVKLLSYLIAEGHTKKIVLFSNSDKKIVDEFKKALYKFDPSLKLVKEDENRYRISQPKFKVERSGKSYKKRSIRKLIEREELFGKLATEKYLSQNILRLNKEKLSLFLNRLFSCDGSIYQSNSYWEVSYSSSSEKLIRQVQNLLLRFEIISKLRYKKIKYKGKIKNSFELVLNEVNALKFINQIGFFGKKEKRIPIAKSEISIKTKNPNIDTIPKEIWETYKPKSWTNIGRIIDYKHPKALRERMKYSPSRQSLLQIAEVENHNPLLLLATSDIFWDEIVSIELLEGNFKVYDICVPDHHNFVANDIIVHNSYSLGTIFEGMLDLPEKVKKNLSIIMVDTMGIYWTSKFPNTRQKDILKDWDLKPKGSKITVYVPKKYFKQHKDSGIIADRPLSVRPSELSAFDWASMFDIDITDPIGVLLERSISELGETNFDIQDIIKKIKLDKKSDPNIQLALENRLIAADDWGIFDPESTHLEELIAPGQVSILDVSVYKGMSAGWSLSATVLSIIGKKILEERMNARKKEELQIIGASTKLLEHQKAEKPIVWIMIDEAHQFLPKNGSTPATETLKRILREGRQPGMSMVLATQQPGEIHHDVLTQSDIVISHRVTAKNDINALNAIMQTYLVSDIQKYLAALPSLKGSAIVLDDNSERMYPIQIRPRTSWHGGDSPVAVKKEKEVLGVKI